MKKTLQILFILIGLTSCKNKNTKDIWISIDERVIDTKKGYSSRTEGCIIDFEKNEFLHVLTDFALHLEMTNDKFKISNDTLNMEFEYKLHFPDSMEVEISDNIMSIFKPLKLNHKLKTYKNQIENFLTEKKFERVRDCLRIEFESELYSKNKYEKNKKIIKSQLFENKEYIGFWSVKEIYQNFFLILSLDPDYGMNIYQIKSLNEKGIKLIELHEEKFLTGLTELKTSL